jgi:type I restriction-modification system DNA methylase subunit
MKTDAHKYEKQFQTPPEVARYMASLVPEGTITVLEPTPGMGNIVRALEGYQVTAPKNFFDLDPHQFFDCVVMNPPFSAKYAFGIPEELAKEGMQLGYWMLKHCMQMSDSVIALMPWFTLTDSDVRLRQLKRWGLISVTSLPRKTFEYIRIQTCVLELRRGYHGPTSFKVYDLLQSPSPELFTT